MMEVGTDVTHIPLLLQEEMQLCVVVIQWRNNHMYTLINYWYLEWMGGEGELDTCTDFFEMMHFDTNTRKGKSRQTEVFEFSF